MSVGVPPRAVGVPLVEVDSAPGRPDVVWLDNGHLRIGAVPALGGRILSIQVDGVETLWRNAALLDDRLHPVAGHVPGPVAGRLGDWNNYGGDKTWPAPQGWSGMEEWAGPPDPVLDSGPYEWTVEDDIVPDSVQVTMRSGDDPRTGLRLERALTVTAGSYRYELELRAVNASDRTVRWSLWNVMQRRSDQPGSGGVDIGVGVAPAAGESADVVAVLAGTGLPRDERSGPGHVHVPHQDVVGKIGFPTAVGWVAHVAGGTTCTISFDVDPAATYPDGGSRVEVWLEHPQPQPLADLGDLDPPDRIVEVEVLGPLTELAPGERTTLTLHCATVLSDADRVTDVSVDGHLTTAGRVDYQVVHHTEETP